MTTLFLLSSYTDDYTGSNAHVILEEYKPAHYTAESHKTNGDSVIRESFDSLAQSSVTGSKRRLFALSANEKVTLKTQMSDLGKSQEFWQ